MIFEDTNIQNEVEVGNFLNPVLSNEDALQGGRGSSVGRAHDSW